MLADEAKKNLSDGILPFWMNLADNEFGGFYGRVDYNLDVDRRADKGTILISRIMWLFSQAYLVLDDERYLDMARHAYEYFHRSCYDKTYGGLYWSTTYDARPSDTVKHTYTMSYGIYGLVAYYEASKDESVLQEAVGLYEFIEARCTDDEGYLEEFDREFNVKDNEKVSDALASRGFYADRTMNTLLHILESYTELFRVAYAKTEKKNFALDVREKIINLLKIFTEKVYSADNRRLEVFFDSNYNSLVDTQSYGHDIESAWLIDYAADVIAEDYIVGGMTDGVSYLIDRVRKMTDDLRDSVYERALKTNHMLSDIMDGEVDCTRIWWVHAEAVNGFYKGYQHKTECTRYKDAALRILEYIKEYFIDNRCGEWFNELDSCNMPVKKELAGPWKCPYHNGRMWLELAKIK